ncbi:hypothetical protein IAD21_03563 [Abditibacteriota bacterium]|nr:hypothetical protein IAD21_03563 [Abditibacteriota bacterium]
MAINLSNPVLTRELRASLRNARAFALLALYVALLGAFATANFPADQSVDLQHDGGKRANDFFQAIFWGQIVLILVIIPALATGALAQERERQTLQPLLLTPLSPLQIVWGKAGGVLSLVGLLLVSTVPLTSLCFLLGGVDTGLIIGSYAVIFGLAAFTTGFGLYCSARWHGATRAMLMCYLLLPVAVVLVAGLAPFGVIICGFFVIIGLFYAILQGWKRGEKSKAARALGELYGPLVYIVAPLLIIALLFFMVKQPSIGYVVVLVAFVLSYFLLVAHWGLLQTARELMNRADDEPNMRQRVEDLQTEWKQISAPESQFNTAPSAPREAAPSFAAGVSAPVAAQVDAAEPLIPETATSGAGQWAALPGQLQTGETPSLPPRATPLSSKRPVKATYGVTPFLSDKMNPIYAREMRSGLLGKWRYLITFGYGITILSEVALLIYLLWGFVDPSTLVTDFEPLFIAWGRVHLGLLMIFAAWFGARAIAPEREGQTLEQLFTIPLAPSQIIGGKMMAVLTFSLYVWILALPTALLVALLGLVRPSTALWFPVAEAVFGSLAASWGVLCSFNSPNVRRALATSMGGAAAALMAHALIYPIFELFKTLHLVSDDSIARVIVAVLPLPLLFPSKGDWFSTIYSTGSNTPSYMVSPMQAWSLPFYAVVAVGIYALLSVGLFVLTARNFQKMARSEPTRG